MKILLVELERPQSDELLQDLRESGHEVTLLADDAPDAEARVQGARPDVILVRLDTHPADSLQLAGRLEALPQFKTASFLFTGGSEFALGAAQRRFPEASFSRLDAVHNALASLDG